MKSLMMTCATVAALSVMLTGCESSEPLGPLVCTSTEAVDASGSSGSAASGGSTMTVASAAKPAPKEIVEPVYFDQAPAPQPSVKAEPTPAPKTAAKPTPKPTEKVTVKTTEPAKAASQPKSIPQPVVINEPLATRPALAPAPDAKKLRTYSVQKGDTLYGISRKFYNGDASKFKDIIRANPGINPDRLLVGTTLNIP